MKIVTLFFLSLGQRRLFIFILIFVYLIFFDAVWKANKQVSVRVQGGRQRWREMEGWWTNPMEMIVIYIRLAVPHEFAQRNWEIIKRYNYFPRSDLFLLTIKMTYFQLKGLASTWSHSGQGMPRNAADTAGAIRWTLAFSGGKSNALSFYCII